MPGYRQWSDGDNLTPADIDSYLMSQTLMRFPNTASRDAALPTPVAGMRSYAADVNQEYRYNGTVWMRAIPIQSGSLSVTPTAANTVTSVVVTFPIPFETIPQVVLTPYTTVPNVVTCGVSSISVTGFTLYMTRTTTTSTLFGWMATN